MSDVIHDHILRLFSVHNGKMHPSDITRTTRAPLKKKSSDTRPSGKMSGRRVPLQEEPAIGAIFNRFRGIEGVDVLWVKEQVYGTPCLPEECPATRSIFEMCCGWSDCSMELEEGEIDPRNVTKN